MEIYVVLVLSSLVLGFNGAQASHGANREIQSNPTAQPHRTSYHFQPPKNWMNDPNGPMYCKGVYHLFYQYNPYAAVWGNISWGHSVSYDLINWVDLNHALDPTEPYDIKGCWSGSTTLLSGHKPVILYTGSDTKNRQIQNLAMPKDLSDPFLRVWIKSPHNPVIGPANGIDPENFRDPTTAWKGPDGAWRVIVGNQMENGHGNALLFKSKDFVNWVRSERPLHSSDKTKMWECPDFFPVGIDSGNGLDTYSSNESIKYVLKASFSDHDHYVLGKYDPKTDDFLADNDFLDGALDLRYDYGNFYASKTFFDSAAKRRILWGWILETDSQSDDIKKGWSGLQSIPRTVLLGKSGRQLIQWPVQEIEKLRQKNVSFQNKDLQSGSVLEVSDVTASQADVEVEFEIFNPEEAEPIDSTQIDPQILCARKVSSQKGKVGPFGLMVLASEDLRERTEVYFQAFKRRDKLILLMCSDQRRSSVKESIKKTVYGAFLDVDLRYKKAISLRSLIDHSVVESFGGEGKSCITARVYPEEAIGDRAKLFVFNNGTVGVTVSKLSAWSMNHAQIVPLQNRRRNSHTN